MIDVYYLTLRFGNIITQHLHIASIFYQCDTKLRPTAYSDTDFARYTGKRNMSIPLPTNTTPILDSGYLSIVQDTQGKIYSTSAPHLYL